MNNKKREIPYWREKSRQCKLCTTIYPFTVKYWRKGRTGNPVGFYCYKCCRLKDNEYKKKYRQTERGKLIRKGIEERRKNRGYYKTEQYKKRRKKKKHRYYIQALNYIDGLITKPNKTVENIAQFIIKKRIQRIKNNKKIIRNDEEIAYEFMHFFKVNKNKPPRDYLRWLYPNWNDINIEQKSNTRFKSHLRIVQEHYPVIVIYKGMTKPLEIRWLNGNKNTSHKTIPK